MNYINYELIKEVKDLYIFTNLIEKGMINMPNISKLSRQLNVDRKTIRKSLKGIKPKTTRDRKRYLDEYRSLIITLLDDEYKEYDYYQHLFNYLVREHQITCSYGTLRDYLLKDDELTQLMNKKKNDASFTIRFETEAGIQSQFDLKEKIPFINTLGQKTRVNVATVTMGYSRKNFRKIVPDTSYDTIIAFLAEAFEYFGGTTKELVIDNIKCLVDKARTDNQAAILNIKFEEFLKDYSIKAKPCMPYRPQTKGKTETQNKVPSQLKNYNGMFEDIYDLHHLMKVINDEDNAKISQGTGFPPDFLFEKEKARLQPLPCVNVRKDYYLKLSTVNVSNESLISYKSNKYSVPKRFIYKKVGRVVRNNKLYIYDNTDLICIHEITNSKFNIKKSHNLQYDQHTVQDELELNKECTLLKELEDILYDNL